MTPDEEIRLEIALELIRSGIYSTELAEEIASFVTKPVNQKGEVS